MELNSYISQIDTLFRDHPAFPHVQLVQIADEKMSQAEECIGEMLRISNGDELKEITDLKTKLQDTYKRTIMQSKRFSMK